MNVAGREVFIYVLIEFQSTPDKSIPVRMLQYIMGLYDQMYRRSTAGKLPAVFPILLYNGKKPRTVPPNLRELIEPVIAEKYIPSFEYYPIIQRDISERIDTRRGVKSMLSEVIDQMEQKYRQEGRQEGLQEGLENGLKRGRGEARRTNALGMLRKNYPIEEVMEITELSRNEVVTLAKQIAATEKD